jgi:hypothetical protein
MELRERGGTKIIITVQTHNAHWQKINITYFIVIIRKENERKRERKKTHTVDCFELYRVS